MSVELAALGLAALKLTIESIRDRQRRQQAIDLFRAEGMISESEARELAERARAEAKAAHDAVRNQN